MARGKCSGKRESRTQDSLGLQRAMQLPDDIHLKDIQCPDMPRPVLGTGETTAPKWQDSGCKQIRKMPVRGWQTTA